MNILKSLLFEAQHGFRKERSFADGILIINQALKNQEDLIYQRTFSINYKKNLIK